MILGIVFMMSLNVNYVYSANCQQAVRGWKWTYCQQPENKALCFVKGSQKIVVMKQEKVRIICDYNTPNRDLLNCAKRIPSDLASISMYNCIFIRYDIVDLVSKRHPKYLFFSYDDDRAASLELNFHDLPNLESITFQNTQTDGRFKLGLGALPKLSTLSFKKHDFKTFPQRPFRKLTNLVVLNFVNGITEELPEDIFSKLHSLNTLDLSANRINVLRPLTFKKLSNLYKLDLSKNRIEVISADLFSSLKELTQLCLRDNRLKSMPQKLFLSMPKMRKLMIDGNVGIESLPTGFFRGAQNLRHFSASKCSLVQLDETLFSDVINPEDWSMMSHLRVANSNESYPHDARNELPIRNQINGISVLKYLDLSSNSLKIVKDETFSPLTALETLNMSSNRHLGTLPIYQPFGPSENLWTVLMKNCNMTKMPNINWAEQCPELNLYNNKIVEVTLPIYSKCRTDVNLSNNFISTIKLNHEGISNHSPQYQIENNRLVCDYNLKDFLVFLHSKRQSTHQVFTINSTYEKCAPPHSTISLIDVCSNGKCPLLDKGYSSSSSKIIFAMNVLIAFLSVALFVFIAALCIHRLKYPIFATMYSHYLYCKCCDRFLDHEEKLYDVFLCFNPTDRDVVNTIANTLEQQNKVCLLGREKLPGLAFQENIAYCIQNSRKMILIMSPDFNKSSWYQQQIREACTKLPENYSIKTIAVYVGDYKTVMSMPNAITSSFSVEGNLKWGSRNFWRKLKFYLRVPEKKFSSQAVQAD